MKRKIYTKKVNVTPELIKFREKRKWQIALRRYVLERVPSSYYAPFFGLDYKNMRQWFEYQFTEGVTWESFGEIWQFDHIIPVTYFDFNNEDDMKMCWNFTNIRVEHFKKNKDRGNRLDVLAAKNYFKELFDKTNYKMCSFLLQKIDQIELSEFVSTEAQQAFIKDHKDYLEMIEGYNQFEFDLLNSGRSIEEVNKEVQFIKNFEK